jgi:hypothetical protein
MCFMAAKDSRVSDTMNGVRRFTMRVGLGLAASFLAFAVAIGCSDEASTTPNAADADAPDAIDADATSDADRVDERDANGPGAVGDTCSFNDDCQRGLRCECDGECACKAGTRGVKKAGASCVDGNDCASAVCLEGPNDALLCSDECKTANDCPDALPLCQDVAYVGRICTRTPPGK